MPGPQARTAWLHASEEGTELAKVSSCRAVASSLAGFTGRCPLPSGVPLPESGAVGRTAPVRSGTPAGLPHGESTGWHRDWSTVTQRGKQVDTALRKIRAPRPCGLRLHILQTASLFQPRHCPSRPTALSKGLRDSLTAGLEACLEAAPSK